MNPDEKWRRLFRREDTPEQINRNIDAELRSHVELRIEQLMAEGLSEEEARIQAREMFGDRDRAEKACRRVDQKWLLRDKVGLLLASLTTDVGYALRMFRANPLFAILASLCMAVGITFTAATYTFINGTLLNPLPFEDADELVMVGHTVSTPEDWTWMWSSFADFREWETQSHSFDGLAVFNWRILTITDLENPLRLRGAEVSEAFDDILRVRAFLGRTFTPADFAPNAERVVLLGYGLWQRAYGSDPGVIGRLITLDGERRHRVVGVMPPHFTFPDFKELWIPCLAEDQSAPVLNNYITFGRLPWGVPLERATSEMREIAGRLALLRPDRPEPREIHVVHYGSFLFQSLRTPLLVIFVVACLVLLLACSNLANLMLSRATGRIRELSVRAVLGAGRGRLVQQVMVESLVIAAVGGTAGIVLGRLGLNALLVNMPREVPGFLRFEMDGGVLAALAGIILASGIIFGMAPALTVRRGALGTSLRADTVRMSAGTWLTKVRSILVVFQIALATVILAVTGMVVRGYVESQEDRIGVDTDRLLGQYVSLPGWAYPTRESRIAFFRDGLDRLQARPGVERVAYISQAPAARTDWTARISTTEMAANSERPSRSVRIRAVSPGYFTTAGIPLLAGRDFNHADLLEGGPRLALVNPALARILWPGEDPLGRDLLRAVYDEEGNTSFGPETATEVIGVAGNVRHGGPGVEPGPCLYVPMDLFHARSDGWFILRTAGNPRGLASALRQALYGLDPQLALSTPRTMAELAREKNWRTIFTTWILTVIAAFALVLALLGVLGVVAYTVTNRTHEFGVRLALGADAGAILRSVLFRGAGMASLGIGAGMMVAFASMRFLSSVLVNTGERDPTVFGLVFAFLVSTTLLASYLPARRVVRIDPVEVLKED